MRNQKSGNGPQYDYLKEVEKALFDLDHKLICVIEEIDKDLKIYELSIKSHVSSLFDARKFLEKNKMSFWPVRDEDQKLIELRVSAHNKSHFRYVEKNKIKPKTEIVAFKVIPKVVGVSSQRIITMLSECQNIEEEVQFLNQKLAEKGFTMEGPKIYNRLGKKSIGVFRYTCYEKYLNEFFALLLEIGYVEPYVQIAKVTKLSRGTRTVVLYTNHRLNQKEPLEKVEKIKKPKVKKEKPPKVPVLKPEKKPLRPRDVRRYRILNSEEMQVIKHAPVDVLINELLSRPESVKNRFLMKWRQQRKDSKNKNASP